MFAQGTDAEDKRTRMASRRSPSQSAKGENFPVLSYVVAPRLRAKVAAFYAYARAADDVADDPHLSAAAKLAALVGFESGLVDGVGATEARRLRQVLGDEPELIGLSLSLLGAFRQDARGTRYVDWEDLLEYCSMSAVPVGRFLLALHGEGDGAARYADPLCIALQILNHLQDLAEDRARLGRVYLPHDLLEAAGASEADLSLAALTAPARAVVDDVLARCDALLDRAAPLPRAIRSAGLRGQAAATLRLARRLGARLRQADPLRQRVAPSRADFVRAGLTGLRAAAWRTG